MVNWIVIKKGGCRPLRVARIFAGGVVLSLALALGAGCSKSEQAPLLPVAPAEKARTPAAADIPAVAPVTDPEVKNASLFREYVKQLRGGDLIMASANLATIKSHLRGEDLSDPFWESCLPSEHRVILLIGSICGSCADGSCRICKGNGVCTVCAGTGLCKACQGRGGEWKPCLRCVCPTCQGTRYCPTCKGRHYVPCPTCGGSGNGRSEKKFEPCPSCGGKGYKDGLKGPNGSAFQLKCIRCNGTRGVYTTITETCPACQGSGRQTCGACKGSGVCPTCRGTGRQLNCPVCGGQGRFLDPCPDCKGAKVCPGCSGAKTCRTCNGQGTCRDCLGRNLIIRYRLPVDRRWLVKPDARLFRPGADGVAALPLEGPEASVNVNGRMLTADVPPESLLWISSPEELRLVRDLFVPES